MRQHYDEITSRGAEVLSIGPDSPEAFRAYWLEHDIPFPGMADPGSRVARAYRQHVHIIKFGRMPLMLILDRQGIIRYRHSGNSMSDIPGMDVVLGELDKIRLEEQSG